MKKIDILEKIALIFCLALLPIQFSSAQTDYIIDFRSGKFNPEEKEIPTVSSAVFGDRRYGLVQFFALPDEAEKLMLKQQGIELLDYLPQNAWCFSSPANLELKKLSSNIRAVFPLLPEFKIEAAMRSGQFPSWAIKEGGNIEFIIQTFRKEDAGRTEIHKLLKDRGAMILDFQPEFQTIVLRAASSLIPELANEAWVQWMEPINPEAKKENLPGKNLHRSSTLEYGIRNLTGSGVKVAIWDGGEVGKHQDFQNRLTLVETSPADDHASHVMGTIGGAGILNPIARGMAPGSTLFSYNFQGDVAAEMLAQQPVRSFTIASHSWGFGDAFAVSNCATGDPYNSNSRNQDLVLINYPNLLHVHSSGNSQTATGCGFWRTTTGKAAKNTLVVGNAQINESLSSSSSTGPVQDGRLKPEISALGTNVFSTTPNNSYMTMSGTSMATPGVSGVMAQLVQRYRQLNSNNDPRSSLLKALVCNTARDRGTAGPDYRFGYGIINGLKAVTAMEENRFEVNSISNGGTFNKTIAVSAGTAQIRVMIAWLDPAGAANANPALINNLNLTVTDPSATVFNPWVLDPANPANAAVRGVDNRNNIEQVTILSPAAGNYSITISGASIPSGPQQYALTWEFDNNGIQILYPNGGEVLQPGTNAGTIFWDSFGVTGNQTVEYSTNNGSSWTSLGTVTSTVNNASWTVPPTVSSQYLMRITQGALIDQSDANFSVIGTPTGLAFAQGCTVGEMAISWNAVSGATQYDVMKLDTVTFTWNVFAANILTTNYTATGLAAAQRHFFAIRAKTASVTGLRCAALVTSGEHAAPFSVTVLADAASGCNPLNTTLRAIVPATTYTSGTATFSTISGTPTNITTWTGDADDGFAQVGLPFSFKFYNSDYNSLFVSTNGFITFGAGSAANAPNTFPTASAPNNVVALCFADLNMISAGSCGYFTSGSAPNRRFVIQYTNVPPYSGTGTLSGQLVFFEGSNIIEMHLSNQNLSTVKTQGLENINGSAATTIAGRNNANWTATNDGRRFTPSLPATFSWTPATGLSSASVQYPTVSATSSGNYSVTVNYNACSSSSNVNLTVQDVPPQPGAITGSSSVCSGVSRTYSIAAVSTATSYTWVLPSGWSGTSTGISISTTTSGSSGNISISGVNACGTGTSRSLAATAFSAVPAQPGSVTGAASVCNGAAQSYSISVVSGSESYSWTLPSGWSGTSTSNSISTSTGSTSGNINVAGVNACGTGPTRSLAVTSFSTVPAQPASIGGPTSVCLNGDPNVYSVPVLSGASSYSWTLPLGWTGASTSNSISTNAPVNSGNVTVSGVNACGIGISRSLAVTAFTSLPAQPSVISASASVCNGSTQNYSIPAMSGVENYHWSFPSGFSPASSTGAGLNQLSSEAGTSGGTVSVYASNACGNGTTRDFNISVSNIPVTPGTITGDASVCKTSLNSYSIASVPEATSYIWTLPSGASLASGNNTNAVTVNFSSSANSGNILVQGSNTCGNGPAAIFSVTVNTPFTWYLDTDGDGYSVNGSSVSACVSPGASYVLTTSGNDCDDADNSIWRTGNFYTDADGDNYTVGAVQTLCYGANTPVGYSASSLGSDCDESNPFLFNNCSSFVWTGASNGDWNNASNWSSNVVPTAGIDVVIPSGTSNTISAGGSFSCHSVTIQSGATVIISSGGVWNIGGNLLGANGALITGAGKVVMNGISAQNISGIVSVSKLELGNNAVQIATGSSLIVLPTASNPNALLMLLPASSLTNNGDLILRSNTFGTGSIGPIPANATLTGNISQERLLPSANGWYFVGAPVKSSTIIEEWSELNTRIFPKLNASMFEYSETDSSTGLSNEVYGWKVPNTLATAINPGNEPKGYRIYLGQSNPTRLASVTGLPFVQNVSKALTFSPITGYGGGGWNLISNPYPCAINWNQMRNDAANSGLTLSNAYYTFNGAAGNYGTYTSLTASSGVGVGGLQENIPSSQAFFVKATGSANLTFKESFKNTNANSVSFLRTATNELEFLKFKVQQGSNWDEAGVLFYPSAAEGLDKFDALNLTGSAVDVATVMANGKNAAIEVLPQIGEQRIIPLKVQTPANGTASFHFEGTENISATTSIYLKDDFLGNLTDIRQQPEISFEAFISQSYNRFSLILAEQVLTSSENKQVQKKLRIYPNPAKNRISVYSPAVGELELFNALGQKVKSQSILSGHNEVNFSGLPKGMYQVRMEDQNVEKLVVE
jgi:hypothetical protein